MNNVLDPRRAPLARTAAPTILGICALAGVVAWWAWRAFHDPAPFDTGLAYQAGRVAWATGHPEHLSTWNGTPLLAVLFAVASRIVSKASAADIVTALNVAAALAALVVALPRIRRELPRAWWLVAAALISFVPLMSTVWWKQFNLFSLVLALGGYQLLRDRRTHLGAIAIALSVSVKPLVILLPLALLLRRETRRAGVLALLWIFAFDLVSQGVLAWRAHDLATIDPTIGIRNFAHKTNPIGNVFMCHPANFAPTSMLCRTIGSPHDWGLQRVAIYLALILLALWSLDALRGRPALSWDRFAFACALSAMVGPIEWAHYEIALAPLFVVLTVRFVREGAELPSWIGLGLAFVLVALIWEPYGSIVDAARGLFGDGRGSAAELTVLDGIAQFAQYVLVITGVIWYSKRSSPAGRRAAG